MRRELLMKCAATAMSSKLIHQVHIFRMIKFDIYAYFVYNFTSNNCKVTSKIISITCWLKNWFACKVTNEYVYLIII